MSSRDTRGAAGGLLVVLAAPLAGAAAFAAPWLRGRMLLGGDTEAFLRPVRAFYAERLAAGEFPLWDPHLFCGFPLHAEGQTGVFHPAHLLLYRTLPVHWALQIEYLLALALAFLGMWLLARRWDVPRTGAAFAGAAFAFSAFTLSHAVHLPLVAVFAHTPLACLAAYGIATAPGARRGLRAALGLAAVIASQLLLGSPPATYLSGLAWGVILLIGLREGAERGRLPRWQAVALVGAGLTTGVLIGAVQWLPTLAFVPQTDRYAAAAAWSGSFSLPPWNLLQFLVPHAFAELTAGDTLSGNSRVEFSVYPGLAILMLAVVGATWRRADRSRPADGSGPAEGLHPGRWIAVAALIAALLMLGRFTGLSELLNRIPVVNGFRAPARHFAVLQYLLVVLATVGAGSVLRDADARQRLARTAVALGAASLLAHLLVAVPGLVPGAAPARTLAASAGGAAALAAAGFLAGRPRPAPRALPWFLLLACLDVLVFGWRAGPADLPQPEIRNLAADLAARTSAPTQFRVLAPWNREVVRGFRNAIGYAALEPRLPKQFDLAAYSVRRMQDPRSGAWRDVPGALPRMRVEPAGAAELEVVRDDPEEQILRTRADRPHSLVVGDRHDPDWICEVDGTRTDIAVHAGALRRVELPAGSHDIRFSYRPRSVRRGAALSGAGIVVFLALAAAGLRKAGRASART